MLVLVCEVCSTPRSLNRELERYLIICSHVICPECKQMSVVSKDLKDNIKRELGMGL